MKRVTVKALRAREGERTTPNQFSINIPGVGSIFQSFWSVVAVKLDSGRVYLDKDLWNGNASTGKYRCKFLGESLEETQKKINSGQYKLVEMNSQDRPFMDGAEAERVLNTEVSLSMIQGKVYESSAMEDGEMTISLLRQILEDLEDNGFGGCKVRLNGPLKARRVAYSTPELPVDLVI